MSTHDDTTLTLLRKVCGPFEAQRAFEVLEGAEIPCALFREPNLASLLGEQLTWGELRVPTHRHAEAEALLAEHLAAITEMDVSELDRQALETAIPTSKETGDGLKLMRFLTVGALIALALYCMQHLAGLISQWHVTLTTTEWLALAFLGAHGLLVAMGLYYLRAKPAVRED